MEQKILQTKKPSITCYTAYGLLFSVLPESMIPWIHNNFIQLRYSKGWNIVTFDNHHLFLSHCPSISFRTIPKYIITEGFLGNIKQLIIEAINANEYVFMYVDRFYIKEAQWFYQKKHMEHEVFIYGYDLGKDVVYLADNLQNGKFVFVECPFSEIEQSYRSIDSRYDFMTDVGVLSVNPEVKSYINVKQIADGLERYIESKETFDVRYEQPCDFGFHVIEIVRDKFLKCSNGDVDFRPFHLLYEHKLLMKQRVEYLQENGYLVEGCVKLSDFGELESDYYTLRNTVMKYNLLKNRQMLEDIAVRLDDLCAREKVLLSSLLCGLIDKKDKQEDQYSF
ncbi:hypothetical protein [Lachnoclostridium phytofermentans]|jgi:hypothetical protein|uniref:hypothetical protein n=1 Tax=Lachnoclostridium phytofermentans TaxID=66219 RepID=UPI0004968CBC|nr:hypothetical protein [Lachnoclostridium phytofermentans]